MTKKLIRTESYDRGNVHITISFFTDDTDGTTHMQIDCSGGSTSEQDAAYKHTLKSAKEAGLKLGHGRLIAGMMDARLLHGGNA